MLIRSFVFAERKKNNIDQWPEKI